LVCSNCQDLLTLIGCIDPVPFGGPPNRNCPARGLRAAHFRLNEDVISRSQDILSSAVIIFQNYMASKIDLTR